MAYEQHGTKFQIVWILHSGLNDLPNNYKASCSSAETARTGHADSELPYPTNTRPTGGIAKWISTEQRVSVGIADC